MKPPLPPMPERIAALPMDLRRGLPIPAMNTFPDGHDFAILNPQAAVDSANNRTCGICANPLDYWLAFIGGPLSLRSRMYTNPPMHRDCATYALAACPHISIQRARRISEERAKRPLTNSDLATLDKPDHWAVGITRDYKTTWQRITDGGYIPTFNAAPFKTITLHHYNADGHIHTEGTPG